MSGRARRASWCAVLALILIRGAAAVEPDAVRKSGCAAQWCAIAGSRLDALYDPGLDGEKGHFSAIVRAWGGAAVVGGRLLLWGGGHADSANNGLFAFDPALGWQRLTRPSPWRDADAAAQTYADGAPKARHTYGNLFGRGAALYSLGGSIWKSGVLGPPPAFWRWDGHWQALADPRDASMRYHMANACAYDARRDTGWCQTASAGLLGYDFRAGRWTRHGAAGVARRTLVAVPERDLLVLVGAGSVQFYRIDDGVAAALQAAPAHGALVGLSGRSPGALWDPVLQRVVVWRDDRGVDRRTVFTIDPQDWSVRAHAVGGAEPPPGAVKGTYGRFALIGDRYYLVNDTGAPVFTMHRDALGAGVTQDPPHTGADVQENSRIERGDRSDAGDEARDRARGAREPPPQSGPGWYQEDEF
ncbi:MAG: hypothetical protein AB7Q97_02715 [Gammaproteobacteria bacterium]